MGLYRTSWGRKFWGLYPEKILGHPLLTINIDIDNIIRLFCILFGTEKQLSQFAKLPQT